MLDVVLFHFCLDYLNVSHKFLSICQGDDAVKIFFFLSGYGLVTSLKQKGSGYLKGFFSRRLAKIVIPAIPIAVINIAYYIISDSFYTLGSFSLKNCFVAFFEQGNPLIYNSWYVVELIVLYAVFYISFKAANCDLQKGLNCAMLVITLAMFIFYIIYLNTEWLYVWFYSTYAFAMGMIWAGKKERIDGIMSRHFNLVYLIILPVFVIIVMLKKDDFVNFPR